MLAGAALIGLSAAPAAASDGVDPLAVDEPAIAELLDQAAAPLGDAVALPNAPTHEGAPATGSADQAPEVASSEDPAGAEAAGNPLENVISGAVERDIAPVVAAVSEPADAPASGPAAEPQSAAVRTAPTAQEGPSQSAFDTVESLLGTAGESSGERTDPQDARPAEGGEQDAAPQYQEGSEQYQSDSISESNSWEWDWYLEMDCDGIVSSISDEKGTSSSSEWTWAWNWKWTCGLDGASERAAEELAGTGIPDGIEISTGGSTTGGQADATEPSWLWTWTFTFCGRTTTIVTPVNVDPELRWLWTWSWTWACTEDPDEPEAEADDGVGGDVLPDVPGDGTDDVPERLPWIDEFVRSEELDSPAHEVIDALLAPGSVPSLFIPPAAAPPTPHAPRPEVSGAAAPNETRPAPPATPRLAPGAPPAFAASGAPAAETAAAERDTRPRRHDASPQRQRAPRAPARAPARGLIGAPPASSGSAPGGSGTGAGGVAALTGFVVLAVPGLGRRIREARELSPRAPLRDRLERPG